MTKRGPKHVPIRSSIKRLLEKGMPVREVAEVLEISTQAVYYHRKTLREAGDGLDSSPASDERQQ